MIALRVTIKSGGLLSFGKVNVRRVVRQGATQVAQEARALIRQSVGGGRVYRGSGGGRQYRGYKSGSYTASAAGAPPTSVTGALARSIKVTVFKGGEGAAIRDAQFYALFLEAGAQGGVASGRRGVAGKKNRRGHGRKGSAGVGKRVLAPRPFLTRALDAKRAALTRAMRAAVEQDVAMVPAKGGRRLGKP